MRQTLLIAVTLTIGWIPSSADAKVIYVNNRTGDDVNDGKSAETFDRRQGPVKSLRRAALLVGPGDVIEIANTGDTYYGSLRLIGRNGSGVESQPVIVNGNGAVVDGSVPVEADAWEALGGGLWRLEMDKKGWYQLVRGDTAVPEARVEDDSRRPTPPAGHWSAWKGAIYYSAEPDEMPPHESFRIAMYEAGVFLYGVRHVVVRNLTLRHFRLDGVNAHDLVDDAVLENLTCEANGRSGVFIGGSSKVTIQGGTLHNNRDASLLLREKAKVDVREVNLDAEPALMD